MKRHVSNSLAGIFLIVLLIAVQSVAGEDKNIQTADRQVEEPRDAEAYYNRGNAYDDKGEYDRAIADYNKAIEINPRDDKAYNNRGSAYYYKGEYNRAWEDVHKAQGLGCQVPPNLLELLRQATGR